MLPYFKIIGSFYLLVKKKIFYLSKEKHLKNVLYYLVCWSGPLFQDVYALFLT
ncbi:hypothetical protein BHE74_00033073 [Ensete ventricosum]|uniref:Uncharacterized protein n=1 Tax=Ensete ventricosum TaxID=4639 RepID=A0A427B5F7_ENSVE|nr:hypothetical protein B296_00001319 [Ensete ventricosum]RWW28379.1 hypothetical protein GW17_00007163 [Ensete ventricosum]RWW59985.1 hypothetical protein BHE74_00033073 [Ensete ventricosum]RZR77352.1 hypothetical protein BHM03_00002393 [Ensete ventricosum]